MIHCSNSNHETPSSSFTIVQLQSPLSTCILWTQSPQILAFPLLIITLLVVILKIFNIALENLDVTWTLSQRSRYNFGNLDMTFVSLWIRQDYWYLGHHLGDTDVTWGTLAWPMGLEGWDMTLVTWTLHWNLDMTSIDPWLSHAPLSYWC